MPKPEGAAKSEHERFKTSIQFDGTTPHPE
jgi:hypothetical protein